ncbi:biopolymer transporter ExbD [Pseudohoeflea suaedae]|uniref:Biopolymer transporter ExbD n=1 Tax=Pseudohoeflea suaedae TaxID=877384 RepID=A0A4R5PPT0_9HYPH|nr:biopolymer transporter ExbD [Pseudohoeflea suaedae]TDH39086.1 biopolymer transporter ExbD [Pseudohoeflea suaedae]
MRVDAPRFVRRRLGLTPLIDVIFLLLLFFMLSSTFSRFSQVPVEGGAAGGAGGKRPDAMISVRAGDVRLNGEGIETGAIAVRLAGLREVGAENLVILVEQGATSQDFVSVLEAASQSGLKVSVSRRGG